VPRRRKNEGLDSGGSNALVLITCNRQGVRILTMFHVTPPGTGREDCIIHLDTEDASQIMDKLKGKGYEVEVRECVSKAASKSNTQER